MNLREAQLRVIRPYWMCEMQTIAIDDPRQIYHHATAISTECCSQGICRSTQIYHHATAISTECCSQTDCTSLSTRSCVRDTSSTLLATFKILDYVQTLSSNASHPHIQSTFVPNGQRHPNSCSQFSITTPVRPQSSLRTTTNASQFRTTNIFVCSTIHMEQITNFLQQLMDTKTLKRHLKTIIPGAAR